MKYIIDVRADSEGYITSYYIEQGSQIRLLIVAGMLS